MNSYSSPQYAPRIDGMFLAAILFIALIGLVLINDMLGSTPRSALAVENSPDQAVVMEDAAQEHPAVEQAVADPQDPEVGSGREKQPKPANARAFAAPYEEYTLTQGPHGYSYGHMAIDITAGKGAAILSPINGKVTDLYVDQYGNPTLVIENKNYRVTLLHGDYTVNVGEEVKQGQKVGKESNQGYTTDMAGVPCAGRNCGYHTHLNVFDKREGANVNPLDLIDK
jgi:murein DD-endopeptidase MepM/ murein hydrolase activator NlpD